MTMLRSTHPLHEPVVSWLQAKGLARRGPDRLTVMGLLTFTQYASTWCTRAATGYASNICLGLAQQHACIRRGLS